MLWIIISIIIAAVDQITKYIVVQNIKTGQMIPVIDKFFYLTLHRNPGGAWSILQNSRLVFLVIIPIISVVLIYFMFKNKSPFLRFALSMILGGAVGNYIDRLLVGKVTDYLLFYFGSYAFPIFNAADMAVTCGTILLAVYMLFIYKEPPQKAGKGLKIQEDPVYEGNPVNKESTVNARNTESTEGIESADAEGNMGNSDNQENRQ